MLFFILSQFVFHPVSVLSLFIPEFLSICNSTYSAINWLGYLIFHSITLSLFFYTPFLFSLSFSFQYCNIKYLISSIIYQILFLDNRSLSRFYFHLTPLHSPPIMYPGASPFSPSTHLINVSCIAYIFSCPFYPHTSSFQSPLELVHDFIHFVIITLLFKFFYYPYPFIGTISFLPFSPFSSYSKHRYPFHVSFYASHHFFHFLLIHYHNRHRADFQ